MGDMVQRPLEYEQTNILSNRDVMVYVFYYYYRLPKSPMGFFFCSSTQCMSIDRRRLYKRETCNAIIKAFPYLNTLFHLYSFDNTLFFFSLAHCYHMGTFCLIIIKAVFFKIHTSFTTNPTGYCSILFYIFKSSLFARKYFIIGSFKITCLKHVDLKILKCSKETIFMYKKHDHLSWFTHFCFFTNLKKNIFDRTAVSPFFFDKLKFLLTRQ